MNKENCALKLVDEIILCYDARSKKHQIDNANLGALAWLRKAPIIFVMFFRPSVFPSFRTYRRGSHWPDILEIGY